MEREKIADLESVKEEIIPVQITISQYSYHVRENDFRPAKADFGPYEMVLKKYILKYINSHASEFGENLNATRLQVYHDTVYYNAKLNPVSGMTLFIIPFDMLAKTNIRMILKKNGLEIADSTMNEERLFVSSFYMYILFPYFLYEAYGKSEMLDEICLQEALRKLLINMKQSN
ncbi:hypothetical protein LFX15_18360 [Leptospira levettii]|uniref:hypothetical protein n=1 Tax=Leptospira levettii TaxID=2023178 RepID=UPI001EEC6C74|nr:hypothetical protein [Leptospira levettii]MCG6150267.1 hypothetical protein [Leptospira levettii]